MIMLTSEKLDWVRKQLVRYTYKPNCKIRVALSSHEKFNLILDLYTQDSRDPSKNVHVTTTRSIFFDELNFNEDRLRFLVEGTIEELELHEGLPRGAVAGRQGGVRCPTPVPCPAVPAGTPTSPTAAS